jgi:ABC-type amino acid transport substrate-binding protein
LQDQRVAVQAGGYAANTLTTLGFDNLIILDSEPGAIAAVTAGRADYALITMYVGYQAIRDLQATGIVALSPPPAFL